MAKSFVVKMAACSDQGGAEGRVVCGLEQSRTMPWSGCQKPPRSCPGRGDQSAASVCLPWDGPQLGGLPCGSVSLLSRSLLSAVSLLWVPCRGSRCTLTRTPALFLWPRDGALGVAEPCQLPHQDLSVAASGDVVSVRPAITKQSYRSLPGLS